MQALDRDRRRDRGESVALKRHADLPVPMSQAAEHEQDFGTARDASGAFLFSQNGLEKDHG